MGEHRAALEQPTDLPKGDTNGMLALIPTGVGSDLVMEEVLFHCLLSPT